MYGFENMIDMGLQEGEWTSPDHRGVAINSCICNPKVFTMEDLSNNVKVINAIPQEQIRLLTWEDLTALGCYI